MLLYNALAEFLRLMAQSHVILIHGKCGRLLKGKDGGAVFRGYGGGVCGGNSNMSDWVNFL